MSISRHVAEFCVVDRVGMIRSGQEEAHKVGKWRVELRFRRCFGSESGIRTEYALKSFGGDQGCGVLMKLGAMGLRLGVLLGNLEETGMKSGAVGLSVGV